MSYEMIDKQGMKTNNTININGIEYIPATEAQTLDQQHKPRCDIQICHLLM